MLKLIKPEKMEWWPIAQPLKQKMSNKKLFSNLVENSLSFLNKAIDEIEGEPVFSLIHFYTGLELLLKARLMHEHWSLIVHRKHIPDIQKFTSGDFQSINLDEILNSLDKTLGIKIAKMHADAFHDVRKHRNRIIHFFHDAQTKPIKKELIITEQLVAWHFLQQIVTTQWSKIFNLWAKDIADIDKKLRKYRPYLKIVFDQKSSVIEKLKSSGYKVENCPSCKFKSLACEQNLEILYETRCEVCNLSEPRINIECPHCNKVLAYEGSVTSHCKHCKKKISITDIEDVLIDHGTLHIRAMEGDFSDTEASCVECDGHNTVITTNYGQLICVACLSEFPAIYYCEWCGEGHTKYLENTYYEGCGECGGASDWRRDD